MPSQEDIEDQQELLKRYRRTLAHYLRQQADHGDAHIPPSISNGIRDARGNIRLIKNTLRSWKVAVEDHPGDGDDGIDPSPSPPSPIPSGEKLARAKRALNQTYVLSLIAIMILLVGLLVWSIYDRSRIQSMVDGKDSHISLQATNLAVKNTEVAVSIATQTVQAAMLQKPLVAMASSKILGRVLSREHEGLKGWLRCGINGELRGFSFPDPPSSNNYSGFDVDYCRVVAEAVLGDADRVIFVKLDSTERFMSVNLPEDNELYADVVFRNTSKTGIRDTEEKIDFGPTIFFDSQRILVHDDLRITNTKQLEDLSPLRICVAPGTTTLSNIQSALKGFDYEIITTTAQVKDPDEGFSTDELFDTYFSQKSKGVYLRSSYSTADICEAVSSDESQLIAQLAPRFDRTEYLLLEEEIPLGHEHLSPFVAEGDDKWLSIVTWAVNSTMQAVELNVRKQDFNGTGFVPKGEVMRQFIEENRVGKTLGLSGDFVKHILESKGNYRDIFNRNIQPLLTVYNCLDQDFTLNGLLKSMENDSEYAIVYGLY
jgi:general L-amino acid transport system substrate-binding protein